MNRDKPKECINHNCKSIIYVPSYKLCLPLICDKCQTKKILDLYGYVNFDEDY
jgi:hypothetical protein